MDLDPFNLYKLQMSSIRLVLPIRDQAGSRLTTLYRTIMFWDSPAVGLQIKLWEPPDDYCGDMFSGPCGPFRSITHVFWSTHGMWALLEPLVASEETLQLLEQEDWSDDRFPFIPEY
jgi:hypothetical protein